MKLIEYGGGCCGKCGYNKNIAALDLHHINPNEKSMKLDSRTLANTSWKVILEEFEKCELLCSNCHREFHNPEMIFGNVLKILESYCSKKSVVNVSIESICSECGVKVSYSSKRCRKCSYRFNKKVDKPDLTILESERLENGITWCSDKYDVSRSTIKRWLSDRI